MAGMVEGTRISHRAHKEATPCDTVVVPVAVTVVRVFSCGGCGNLRLCLRLWSGPLSGADAPLTGGTDLDPHPACGVPCSAVVTVCHPPSLPIK